MCAKMQPNKMDLCRVRVIILTLVFKFVSVPALGTDNSPVVTASTPVVATAGKP